MSFLGVLFYLKHNAGEALESKHGIKSKVLFSLAIRYDDLESGNSMGSREWNLPPYNISKIF